MNIRKTVLLMLLAASALFASAQKGKSVAFSLQGGLTVSRYDITVSTVPPYEYPELRKGLGNYLKASADVVLLPPIGLNLSGGLSAERISSEIMKSENTPVGTVRYPVEVNALQHFFDMETVLDARIRISESVRLRPFFGVGSSIALTEESRSYGYLLPGVRLLTGKVIFNVAYKFAHYNSKPRQITDWYDAPPTQFLVRPRVWQFGLGYQIGK